MGHITPTPVPYKKLMPLAIIYFIEAFVFTNIFSYIGFMVLDFNLTTDPEKVGYYAGYIGSTFSVAGFLSSFWWGRISDKYGRRPVLLFGCVGGLISTLLFGFSTSLEMAIATRFAAGILNGNVGVVKGMAADICDKTNQVKGVGVMQLGWGLGGIIGPLIGGILSRPCSTFQNFCSEGSLFWKYPYLLPNLFSCGVSVLAIITLIIYLPKDEKRPGKIEMKQLSANEFSIGDDATDTSSGLTDMTSSDESDGGRLQKESATITVSDASSPGGLRREDSIPDGATLYGKLQRESSMTSEGLLGAPPKKAGLRDKFARWWEAKKNDKTSIFSNKIAMLTVLSYSILGASFTMYDEAFPLFTMSKIDEGGLGFTTADIGAVGAINGVSAVLIQLVIFYPVATRLGFVRLYRLGLIIGILLFANYPALHYAVGNKILLWFFVAASTITKVLAGQFAFSAVTAMVSNTCSLTQVGSINGFAQSLVALLRAFSPAIAGNLLAWGFSNGYPYPLNQFFVFIMMSVGMGVSLAVTALLPRTLDYPYVDPEEEEEKEKEREREKLREATEGGDVEEGGDEKEDEKEKMIPKEGTHVIVMDRNLLHNAEEVENPEFSVE
eukprot:Phypoly_transcript_05026.p1 GENE.Phypoly_transcript_05026~~Phypoly_transcript_05026.p1  ORF type:complete len:610 (+),score=97.64 Phypoly_transcript_05026:206-2035(+)